MQDQAYGTNRQARALWIMSMVNVAIWAIALIGLVFVMQRAPSAKGLFPILGGGSAVGIAMISAVQKLRSR